MNLPCHLKPTIGWPEISQWRTAFENLCCCLHFYCQPNIQLTSNWSTIMRVPIAPSPWILAWIWPSPRSQTTMSTFHTKIHRGSHFADTKQIHSMLEVVERNELHKHVNQINLLENLNKIVPDIDIHGPLKIHMIFCGRKILNAPLQFQSTPSY